MTDERTNRGLNPELSRGEQGIAGPTGVEGGATGAEGGENIYDSPYQGLPNPQTSYTNHGEAVTGGLPNPVGGQRAKIPYMQGASDPFQRATPHYSNVNPGAEMKFSRPANVLNVESVVSLPNPVDPFCYKDSKGEYLGPTALDWIRSVESFFTTEEVPAAKQVKRALTFISKDKGKAWKMLSCDTFLMNNVHEWSVFRTKFLELFGEPLAAKPMEALLKTMKTTWREDEEFMEFVARVTRNVQQTWTALEVSSGHQAPTWIMEFVLSAVVSNSMGEQEAAKFRRRYQYGKTASEQIAKLRHEYPALNRKRRSERTVRAVKEESGKPDKPRKDQHPKKKTSDRKPEGRCYKCEKYGHWAADCYSRPYCGVCRKEGHARGHQDHPCKNKGWISKGSGPEGGPKKKYSGNKKKDQNKSDLSSKDMEKMVRAILQGLEERTIHSDSDDPRDFRDQGAGENSDTDRD